MQIKKTPRAGYIQIVHNKWDKEKGRSVNVNVGSMSIFKTIPPALWAALDGDEQAKLSIYVGQELAKCNLGKIRDSLAAWPQQFEDLASVWPAVADELGADEAIRQLSVAEKSFKRLKKAAKTVSKTEEIDDEK